MLPVPAASRLFPPEEQVQVKALACERPQALGLPLARLSVFAIALRAWELELTRMSYSTIWRLLHRDALRPWFQKQWLFPRDPQLAAKAAPILDLYHRCWQGEPLGPHDRVLCGDELTNITPLARHHSTQAPAPGRVGHYEHGHDRQPADRQVYLALLDVFTGRVTGQVGPRNGIEPFDQLVRKYLDTSAAATAQRIFLILDGGSAHHANTAPKRLAALDERIQVVSLPTHSSWLNQIEIYFSIVKRKALTPNDLPDAAAIAQRLYGFERHYNREGEPFTWTYTKEKLDKYLKRLTDAGCWPPQAVAPNLTDNPLTH